MQNLVEKARKSRSLPGMLMWIGTQKFNSLIFNMEAEYQRFDEKDKRKNNFSSYLFMLL